MGVQELGVCAWCHAPNPTHVPTPNPTLTPLYQHPTQPMSTTTRPEPNNNMQRWGTKLASACSARKNTFVFFIYVAPEKNKNKNKRP